MCVGGNAVPGAQDGHGARVPARVPTERRRASSGRAGSPGAWPLCGRGLGAGRPLRARPISARARRAGAGAGVCEDAPRSLSA